MSDTMTNAGRKPASIIGLDHLVVLTHDLDGGISTYQALLGLRPAWRSDADGSATACFTTPNATIELLAPSGSGAAAEHIRTTIAEQGEGLASVCFRVGDIAAMHRRLGRVALNPDDVANVERTNLFTLETLKWKRTRVATDAARGVRLFFLEMDLERPTSEAVASAPVLSLDHIVITTRDPEAAAGLYGARLGLDMALDRSHPDWGRLMFFRCGDLIVEVVRRANDTATTGPDRLWGLSWRVLDIDATRRRLVEAGIEVSDVRTGRRPGTRVASVRSGTLGIATLLIEKNAP